MEIGLLTRIDLLVTREPEKRIFQPKKKLKFEQKRRYFAQIDLHFVHPVIFPLFLFQHIFDKIFQYYLIQIFIFQCRTFV